MLVLTDKPRKSASHALLGTNPVSERYPTEKKTFSRGVARVLPTVHDGQKQSQAVPCSKIGLFLDLELRSNFGGQILASRQ